VSFDGIFEWEECGDMRCCLKTVIERKVWAEKFSFARFDTGF